MCSRYTLTADLKKVADRFGAPMAEGEHLNAQRSTHNTQRPSEGVGDSDGEGNERSTRLIRKTPTERRGYNDGPRSVESFS
jgi:hypothetical protein